MPTQTLSKRLSHAKDIAPLFALGLAVLYGVGWAVRYQAVASIGVGPLTVSRETAVTATLAVLLAILPSVALSVLLEWLNSRRKGSALRYWAPWILVLAILAPILVGVLYALLVSVGGASPTLFASLLAFLAVQWVVTPVAFLARVFAAPERTVWLVLGPALVFALGTIFARTLPPQFPESLGGLGRDRVRVILKDPSDRIVGTFAATDDRHAVFTRVERWSETVSALKIPLDRIVEVAAAPHP